MAEALWGVKWFYVYLYGRRFTLITDHKPLTAIFHPEKGVPAMTAARLQRYALFLAGFDYRIEYSKSTAEHCNAGGLARLPLQPKEREEMGVDSSELFHASQFVPLPVTSEAVARETRRDPVLARVHESIVKGWSARVDGDKPYYGSPRLHSMGNESGNPQYAPRQSVGGATQQASGCDKDESTSKELHLLA